MTIVHIKVKYRGVDAIFARFGSLVFARQFNQWIQNSYVVALRHWHTEMLPKHFNEGAASRYGYRRRSGAYTESKRQSEGHTRPLVYSGDSQRATEGPMVIRTSSKSGRLSMDGGNLTFSQSNQRPTMAEELTMVTEAEDKELADILDRDIERQMRGDRSQLTKILG